MPLQVLPESPPTKKDRRKTFIGAWESNLGNCHDAMI